MANEPATGLLFRSQLGTPEMAARLEEKMPELAWRLGDSDQYRYYYISGRRADGLDIKITPEDAADEYHLGVYFHAMALFPGREEAAAIAGPLHREVLEIVEGVVGA